MTLTRQYIPTIGKSVKLKEWSDYSSRNLSIWAWLRVHSINSDGAVVQVLNGSEPTSEVLTVPLSAIDGNNIPHSSAKYVLAKLLIDVRKLPALQTRFEKQFDSFDEILPPADPEYSDVVKELLAKWKPPEGLPN